MTVVKMTVVKMTAVEMKEVKMNVVKTSPDNRSTDVKCFRSFIRVLKILRSNKNQNGSVQSINTLHTIARRPSMQ